MEDFTSYVDGHGVGSRIESRGSPTNELIGFLEGSITAGKISIEGSESFTESRELTVPHRQIEELGSAMVILDEPSQKIQQKKRLLTSIEPHFTRDFEPDIDVAPAMDQRGHTQPHVVVSGSIDQEQRVQPEAPEETRSIDDWRTRLEEEVQQLQELESRNYSLESEQIRGQYRDLIECSMEAPPEAFEIHHLAELLEASRIDSQTIRRNLKEVFTNLDTKTATHPFHVDDDLESGEATWETIRGKATEFFGDTMNGYFTRMEDHTDSTADLRLEMFKLLLESEAKKLPDSES